MNVDTSFAPEDLAFRDEVRAFFAQEYDAELQGRLASRDPKVFKQAVIDWQKRLHEKGWIAPNWPADVRRHRLGCRPSSSFTRASARPPGSRDVVPFGLKMVGPVIYHLRHGGAEGAFPAAHPPQRRLVVPGLLRAGRRLGPGLPEDRAVRDGDDYVVNGAKIWTTYAQHADWIFCLVRTSSEGKKQEGISFLLIDMKSPGIKVNPIVSIDNHHSLNEVEFNNVRVPVANLIGEQDKGWTYAKALLAHERTSHRRGGRFQAPPGDQVGNTLPMRSTAVRHCCLTPSSRAACRT
jgi:alkylation response protein AidB-like acyl-CoA dehydrogenase